MERKIGEIFEHKGVWFQCVNYDRLDSCGHCAFLHDTETCWNMEVKGCCEQSRRDDGMKIIFMKLKKIGNPYVYNGTTCQLYKSPIPIYATSSDYKIVRYDMIEVEVKQNQENMEENKKTISLDAAKDIYEELKGKTVQCLVNNEDGDLVNGKGVVCGYKDKYLIVGFTTEYEGCIKSFTDNGVFLENRDSLSYRFWNMSHINERLVTKPFNLELAKAGKPVCTRDGREARIICFDRRGKYPIVVLVKEGEEESLFNYNNDGYFNGEDVVSDYDLMMLPEKHEGWLNVYRHSTPIYDSEEKAMSCIGSEKRNEYVATVKVEWEE